jgi:hypothetical protein
VFSNGGDGIAVSNESIVWRNIVTSNGGHGISCISRCVVEDNTSTGNGQRGGNLGAGSAFGGNVFSRSGLADVSGGHASRGNQCEDRSCSSRGARRFYLTPTGFTGPQALNGCAPGFHMASMWEILDVTELEYDVARGLANDDAGFGPPIAFGRVRTGAVTSDSGPAGGPNCSVWTSTSGTGSSAILWPDWNDPSTWVRPWLGAVSSCSAAVNVWCVED